MSVNHPESTISVNCSCLHCESLSCFAKRGNNHHFTCPICDKPRTCLYQNDHREGRRNVSDDITAPYFNAAKPKANRDFEELTKYEINFESERKTLLETNQPPPHSLDEYLDRFLCVNKTTSKFKETLPSLSKYIDIISENAAYKQKLNLFKEYVQSFKEAKPSNSSEDLTNSENYMDSLYPQQWYNSLSESSGQPRKKDKCKCQPRCMLKQEPNCQHVTQIQNAMISYPIMNYKHESTRLNTHPESTISVNCSCLHCECLSCFAERGNNHRFTCPICNKPRTCLYHNDHREGRRNISEDIAAPYVNAEKPKASTKYDELTEDEIKFESERKTLLETNQPPPHSLDEYLDRFLCVNKESSKLKQAPPSLSGYIDIISENAAYKQKLNIFKEYVQSLKEAKPSNRSEDLTNSETFKDSLYPQQWDNRLPEISDQPRKKDKCECQRKCLVKQETNCQNVTQIQNAMISYPIIDYKHESTKNTQASKVLNENYKDSCKTSSSNENNFFKYDIFKKFKEAYLACSCKVCECITPKLMNDDICKCKPCQCAECKGCAATQSNSEVSQLSTNVPYSCSVYNYQSALKTQEECSCVPCECEICHMNNAAKYSDVRKPFLTRQPLVITPVTRTVCTCLPCDCSQCLESYTVGLTFSDDNYKCLEKSISNFNNSTASISEIYRQRDNKNKNIKQNFVALCTGVPRLNTNCDFESRRSKTCICKECECITCVCKENTINAIKSSGFFSTIDESAHLLKSNSGNNHYYDNRPYRICKACSRKGDLLDCSTDKWDKPASCGTCNERMRLSDGSRNQKTHLNRCRCTNCRCERCIAHRFASNYPSTVGVCPIKKGEVLSPSAHQSKIQKLKLEEKATPTDSFYKCESRYKNINSYINPQMENMNYLKDVTSRPSVSRQAKRDMGTMLSKSFNRWNVLQCDAYVHSQEFNITKPLLKNTFTTSRSRSSINSITRSSSQKNQKGASISEDKTKSLKLSCHSSRHDHSNYLIRLPKLGIKKCEFASNLDVPNDLKLSTAKPSIENMIAEKQENIQSFHNNLPGVTSSKVNESEKTDGSYSNGQVLTDEIGKYKTNNCFLQPSNNIFTEITSSNKVNDCKNKACYSLAQVQLKEPGKHTTNINSKSEIVSTSYQPLKSLSTSAITTLESLIILNSEQISNNKSSKSANNNTNTFNCFRVLQNLKQSNLIGNIYNHYNSPKVKIRDLMTNSNLLDIKNHNEKARRTLEDAKKFSLHLLSLLEMYEKANNEFVKISDILKTSYTSLLDRKLVQNKRKNINQLENYPVNLNSKSNSSFEETTTPTMNTIAKRLNDSRTISQKSEMSHINEFTSNQESSSTDLQILETINKANNSENKENIHKKYERICYANMQNERSKRNFKKKITPEYDKKLPIHESRTAAATLYADLKQDEFEPLIKSVDHLSKSASIDTTKKYIFSPTINKEVKTEPGPACINRFGLTAKPNIISKRAGISGSPSLQVDTQKTIISKSTQHNTTNTIKKEKSRHEKEALQQVRTLLDLAILEPLNYVDDIEDNLLESSNISDQSILNLDIKEQLKSNKSQQPKHVDKEVWCSDQNLLDDLKREIREQLKVACMHPLISKASSLGSYSCSSEYEDLKARFLVVRKISEHTALLRWSQPRGLGVQGYEVLVDGRTVQKIFNPSKCLTAVTCLPHTDKILLTIRTITSFTAEVGHYPTTTTIYWPHRQ